jgi:hypothetical protein
VTPDAWIQHLSSIVGALLAFGLGAADLLHFHALGGALGTSAGTYVDLGFVLTGLVALGLKWVGYPS